MLLSRLVRPVTCVANMGGRQYHNEVVDYKFPTMEEMPIPEGPWQELHDKRQRRYNLQLVAGIALFAITFTVGNMSGAFWANMLPPNVDIPYNDYSKK